MRAISSMIGRGLAALAERVNPAVPEAMAGRVRMEQVQSILRMTPVMMSANIVIALLVNLAGLTVDTIDTFARALNACLQGEPA